MTKAPYRPYEVSKNESVRHFTHPEDPDDHVGRDLKVVPIPVVRYLEQHKLAGSIRVHRLAAQPSFAVGKGTHGQSKRGDQSADKALPHGAIGEHLIHLLRGVRAVTTAKLTQPTSMENSTPPIGDPKATATPAALDAVTISRIFTERVSGNRPQPRLSPTGC
jgi:hypothetical protein